MGSAAAVAGVVAVFDSNGGAGSAALITVGLGIVILGALAPWIKSLKAGGVELELHRAEAAVRELLTVELLAPLSEIYVLIRKNQKPSPKRTSQLDRLFELFAQHAVTGNFAKSDVIELFAKDDQSGGSRIVALALMKGDPRLRDLDVVLAPLHNSKSAFELYHALRLAEEMFDGLKPCSENAWLKQSRSVETER